MEYGRLSKDSFYRQLLSASRPVGRPKLRCKDAYKRGFDGSKYRKLEPLTMERVSWRSIQTYITVQHIQTYSIQTYITGCNRSQTYRQTRR